jgi:phospholipid/cholesterol/gamma-HCH transport system ATP-binding protein
LEIPENQITVILGRSGQGKSVLLKHIIGLLRPDEGQVFIDGEEVTNLSGVALNKILRKCGMLFQDAALFDSMDVFDNVAFPLVEHTDLSEQEISKKVVQALDWVGLQGIENRWPDQLSGGMRKRVGLARAIVLEPQVILYDEPTTGLDPITSAQIDQLIVSTQRRLKMTALVISHDLESARTIADKIVMLNRGVILEQGTSKEFFASKNPGVQQFLHGQAEGPLTQTDHEA